MEGETRQRPLEGIYPVDETPLDESDAVCTTYPAGTAYVVVQHDVDDYYNIWCFDEDGFRVTDHTYARGHRPEHRVEGALESEPENVYSMVTARAI